MTSVPKAAIGCLAALAFAPFWQFAAAADLAGELRSPPVVIAPPGAPLGAAVMYSPVRAGWSRRIQTHVVAQPAPNPRAIGEGPVMGTAYPVIIVVKPSP